MIYQISSGQGPAECELGVAKLLDYLKHITTCLCSTLPPDIMLGPSAPSVSTRRRTCQNIPALFNGSAGVHTAPVTSGKTGSLTFISAKQ